MKRNNASVQQARRKKRGGKSAYAAKRGKQMYGPGCCAHDRIITDADREEMRRLRDANNTYKPPRLW